MCIGLDRDGTGVLYHRNTGDHLQRIEIEYPSLVLILASEHGAIEVGINGDAFHIKIQVDGLDDCSADQTESASFLLSVAR